MRRKLFGIAAAVTMFAGGAAFALGGSEAECALKGTPDCPLIEDCPLKGTPDCPLVENTAQVADCCRKS